MKDMAFPPARLRALCWLTESAKENTDMTFSLLSYSKKCRQRQRLPRQGFATGFMAG
jgi:hypothetical protein